MRIHTLSLILLITWLPLCSQEMLELSLKKKVDPEKAEYQESSEESANNKVHLSIEQCLNQLLDNSLMIKANKLSPKIKEQDAKSSLNKFKSVGSISAIHEETNLPSDFIFDGTTKVKRKNSTLAFQIDKTWESGTETSLSWGRNRNESNTTFNKINPAYGDEFALEISHPLFQGSGKRIQRADYEQAKNLQAMADLDYLMDMEARLLQVYYDYWQLALSIWENRLNQERLELAQEESSLQQSLFDQQRSTELQLDISHQKEAYARRNMELSEANIRKALWTLKSQLLSEDILNEAELEIIPVSPIMPFESLHLGSLKECQKIAINHRLELKQKSLFIANSEVKLLVAKDIQRPSVDLIGRGAFTALEKKYLKGFGKVIGADYPSWQIGVNVSFFLDRQTRKSQLQSAILSHQQIGYQKEALLIEITKDIAIAQESLLQIGSRLKELDSRIQIVSKNLQSVQASLKQGRLTPLDELKAQLELSENHWLRQQLLVSYHLSHAQYLASQGILLKTWLGE
ncbi:MAG: TolC family protein [Planctomycetes bacterium]|nr:TolC family protein [Planctomycetota bacterium]